VLRDKGPIHNVGFGVTSREFTTGDDEQLGVSPQSGFITRALEGRPIVKMASAMLATGIASTYAGKFLRQGGLKLGYKIAQSAANSVDTSAVSRVNSGLLKARSILDELEGVSRLQDGASKLVFKDSAGKLTTGYEGHKSVVNAGYAFLGEGRRASATEVWHYRDELQQRLVRQVRRLPYEVPALYAADKFITRPLFLGPEEKTGPQKKWYDPSRGVDIAKDLAKTTLFQLGGFVIPSAAAGAAKESSLNFFRTAQERLLSTNSTGYSTLTKAPFFGGGAKHAVYERSLNLKGILEGVGQDLFSVLDKSIKFSERSSGALASAFLALNDAQKNPVLGLYSQRRGVIPQGAGTQPSRKQVVQDLAKDIYKGNKKALNRGLQGTTKIDSLLDLIPGYKALSSAAKTGHNEYRKLSFAQQFIDTPGNNYNQIRRGFSKILNVSENSTEIDKALGESILNIQRKRSSDLFKVLDEFNEKVGPQSNLSNSFQFLLRQGDYKQRLIREMVSNGLDETTAKRFASGLQINDDVFRRVGKKNIEFINPTERFNIGNTPIVGEDFFGELISRFNRGKVGKGSPIPESFTPDALRQSISNIDNQILRSRKLNSGIAPVINAYGSEVTKNFHSGITSSVLKQQKLSRLNFLNQAEGQSASAFGLRVEMAKRAGKVLGLQDEAIGNSSILTRELAARGLDINNPAQLRAYLINNKEMTRSGAAGIAGVLGLSGLTLDDYLTSEGKTLRTLEGLPANPISEAARANILTKGGSTPQSRILSDLIADAGQYNDISSINTVKGYYKFTAGDSSTIVNLNPLKAGARRVSEFLADEVRIPIININPLQMLGFRDFSTISKAGRFQVVSGSANHPFIKRRRSSRALLLA
jgi:hypothetical protein